MIKALVFMVIWVVIGLWGCFLERNDKSMVPIVAFMVAIPFFPWIFKFCGLV